MLTEYLNYSMKPITKMKKRKVLSAVLIILSAGLLHAQENSELKLSLKEAQDYALANNKSAKSARFDVEASKYGVWDAISAGLLQVNSNASVNNNLIVMTRIIDMNGVQTPFKFGTNYDLSYGITASTSIFNAPYLVGIQTAKLGQKLARLNVENVRARYQRSSDNELLPYSYIERIIENSEWNYCST